MLKVLLVDDEIITIRMLQSLINWEKYNLEMVGYAEDGLEATEMFLKYEPDIIISDIRMPNMSGIEFIRKVREINKETAFILISAYSDFSYISEALKIGCSDYILKPIDEYELDEALKKVSEEISGQNEQKEMIEKSIGRSRLQTLHSFMKSGVRLNDVLNKKMEYPINFAHYHILMMQLNYKTIVEYANMQHIESIKTGYISLIIEEVLQEYEHVLFDYEEDAWTILLSDISLEKLLSLSNFFKQKLKEQFEINVVVCFSDVIKKLENLPLEYNKVKMLSRYSFYVGTEEILGYGYNCTETEFNEIRGFNLVKEMEEALEENDKIKADKILGAFL